MPTVTATCRQCGREFRGYQHRKRQSTPSFCGKTCQYAHTRKYEDGWRVNWEGYVTRRRMVDGKYIEERQHRSVMEEHLGRKLLPSEDVHHKNGDRTDNRLENLEVRDHLDHSLLHLPARMEGRRKFVEARRREKETATV